MKILILSLSPIESTNSATFRTKALAEGLSMLDHKVDYLTIPAGQYHAVTDSQEFGDNIKIIRTSSYAVYDSVVAGDKAKWKLKKIIITLLRKLYHSFMLYDHTYFIVKNIDVHLLSNTYYDLVISSSDPKSSHIAVKKLIKEGLKYKKWIQYWGDPMAIDITNKSIHPRWYIKRKEYELLKDADRIIYVSPFTLKRQKEIFPKIADKMDFIPIPYFQKKLYPKYDNKRFTIGYYGAYNSRIRNIIPLYNSCIQMSDKVHLDIIGDSDLELSATDNVSIFPRGNISQYEEKADLLICMLNSRGTQIPGKVYHYAATNKPILILLDGDNKREMKEYLESFNRYIICDNDVDSIVSTIYHIMAKYKEYEPCRAFEPENVAKVLLNYSNENESI